MHVLTHDERLERYPDDAVEQREHANPHEQLVDGGAEPGVAPNANQDDAI